MPKMLNEMQVLTKTGRGEAEISGMSDGNKFLKFSQNTSKSSPGTILASLITSDHLMIDSMKLFREALRLSILSKTPILIIQAG